MNEVDKTKPDALRVTEYILAKSAAKDAFSVQSAAISEELNGIDRYQIATIMKDICLDLEEPGSLMRCTTINDKNSDNVFCRWQLTPSAYFNYLSYQSLLRTEKGLALSNASLKQSKRANYMSAFALLVAAASFSFEIIKEFLNI